MGILVDIRAIVERHFLRVAALICLVIGLGDVAQLGGLSSGTTSPLAELGVAGFVFLAIFGISHLFAAVGLWIYTSWGGALLIGVTLFEYGLVLTGSPDIHLSGFSLAVRLLLALGVAGFLIFKFIKSREHVHD